ncbi:MAG: hypothetical protein IKR76_07125, partial [Ruminococcus sp.]|nr:hypothetical protein [Ruminococcus sp.]
MKRKKTSRRKRIEALALCAAMIFTFAADSVIHPQHVLAQADDSSEEEVEAQIKSDIMQIDYGSVEFWRWERVNRNNYPRDDKEHMSLFIFGDEDIQIANKPSASETATAITIGTISPAMAIAYGLARNLTGNGIGDGKLFSALAPGSIYIGPSASPVSGVS